MQGEGKVVAVPDVARFTFSTITQGGLDIAALQAENTSKVNKAIAFVKSNGVDAKDIRTESFNLEPRYQYFSCPRTGGPCPPPEIVGYTARQTVSIKVRDFAKIGALLSGVVENGANSVSQLSFTIDDPFAVENEARAEAIAKAQEKAKAVARAAGFRIGRLISVDEGYTPIFRTFDKAEALGFGGAAPAAAPSIEPGSQEVMVTVTLRYEIQ
ncbi:MAG: SIMPL domain-containing protein [Candidatus Liptonbacteria bacterium]|nr:SIMPL domain-containing protein [Candidatus Liptonbacteria bacterium]